MLAFRLLAASYLMTVAGAPLSAFEWDRQKAFDYLEARQQLWAEWKPAQKNGGACVSCHTGLPYLLARRALAGTHPRPLERGLAQGVKSRLLSNPPKTMLTNPGAEVVICLLTLALVLLCYK